MLTERHYNADLITERKGGITADDVAGYDVVWFTNPGYPFDDVRSIDTLTTFLAAGGGVVAQGDDITQSMGGPRSTLDNAVIETWHSTLSFELRAPSTSAPRRKPTARCQPESTSTTVSVDTRQASPSSRNRNSAPPTSPRRERQTAVLADRSMAPSRRRQGHGPAGGPQQPAAGDAEQHRSAGEHT